jgi:glycosyltransferase involved in cell wall biosynthesis
VPVYNTETSLAETLNSALRGTYRNIEVVVVDDGSTDSSAAIAREVARTDNRVQVHSRPRGGVSAALNFGFERSRGDYVARLDSDDVWHPSKLEKQIKLAAADPAAGLIYCFVRYIDVHGHLIRDVAPQRFPRHALCRCLYEGIIGGNSSTIFRRSAIAEAGGYDEKLGCWEDLLLQLAISARHPVGFVPEYLVGYRVRPGSISSRPHTPLHSWDLARERIGALFPQIPRFVRRWAHGTRMVHLAEAFAWVGDYAMCAKLLARGFISDPIWTRTYLGYRLRRRFKGRPGIASSTAIHFDDCLPDRQYRLDPFDRGSEGSRVHRLQAARRRELDLVDVRIQKSSTADRCPTASTVIRGLRHGGG